jgi:hypothetical protein
MKRLSLLLLMFASLGSGQVNTVLQMLEPAKPEPLTDRQRFNEYLRTTVGILPIVSSAASAGFSQWMDSPKEWGQGAAGYGRRVADSFGFNAVRTTITFASSIPLHEDNRYFASTRSSFGGRVAHALLSPVTARGVNGHRKFSFSSTGGMVGATLIEQAWAPPSWRSGGYIAHTLAVTYAWTAGMNLVREFVPDLLHRRK